MEEEALCASCGRTETLAGAVWTRRTGDPSLVIVATLVRSCRPRVVTGSGFHWTVFILRHSVQRFSGSLERGHGGGASLAWLAVPLLLRLERPLIGAYIVCGRAGLRPTSRSAAWIWSGFRAGLLLAVPGTRLPSPTMLYGCTPLFILIGLAHQPIRQLVAASSCRPGLLFILFPLAAHLVLTHSPAGTFGGDGFRARSWRGRFRWPTASTSAPPSPGW